MADNAAPADASLTEVLDGLTEQGYDSSFVVADDASVSCRSCGSVVGPTSLHVDGLRRIEGASDPADMAAVLAVRCPHCDAAGTIVTRYGPEAGPGDAELLTAVEQATRDELDVAERASRTESEPTAPGGDPESGV